MIYWNDVQATQLLQKSLSQDRIVLASGDTVLGLWGNITQTAYQALNEIKQRHDKPYLITIASTDRLFKFIDQNFNETLQTLIETCWPGPVTVVFKARKDLPSWMVSSEGTIALRIPDHEGLLDLLKHFDGLFSTSANIASKPVQNCLDQIDPAIISKVDLVCLEREQECYSQSPSTILDCSSGKIQVLRSGALSPEKIKDLIA